MVFNIKKNKLEVDPARLPRHIAIIMDGNGRWAQKRGLPRTYGHKVGAETLRKIVTIAADLGIRHLTAYAFSTENWRRPTEEVDFLMSLFSNYLDTEIDYLVSKGARIFFIGDRSRLSDKLQAQMQKAEAMTSAGEAITVNLAVNYGGRAEILHAVNKLTADIQSGSLPLTAIDESVFSRYLFTNGQPDPDLLIRPGGDKRVSNFLLWQLAYAEFWFTDELWPDFSEKQLIEAISDFQKRERRFGGVPVNKPENPC
jgi:undecaprenyl diphosphate synthase